MTSITDLVGLGTPPAVAFVEGYASVAITAAGSSSANAAACDPYNDVFILTATGADGIRMNSGVGLLQPLHIVNTSGSSGLVYPATGGNFNGGATDAGITIATHKAAYVMRVSTTLWIAINSA
jgi:hypothetical protein